MLKLFCGNNHYFLGSSFRFKSNSKYRFQLQRFCSNSAKYFTYEWTLTLPNKTAFPCSSHSVSPPPRCSPKGQTHSLSRSVSSLWHLSTVTAHFEPTLKTQECIISRERRHRLHSKCTQKISNHHELSFKWIHTVASVCVRMVSM